MEPYVGDTLYSRLPLLYNGGIFLFHSPFVFHLLAIWNPSLPWSDLIIIPVCSNPWKKGRGVLMTMEVWPPFVYRIPSYCKKCVFSSTQGSSQMQNTSQNTFTGLQTAFFFSLTLCRESHWYRDVAQSPPPCALQANTVQSPEPGFDVSWQGLVWISMYSLNVGDGGEFSACLSPTCPVLHDAGWNIQEYLCCWMLSTNICLLLLTWRLVI